MNCTIPFLAIKRISYVIIVINLIFPLILLGQFRVVYSGSDPNNSIQKVHFLSPSTGYAGFEKYIGYTQDSGHTFLKQYITPDKVDFNGYDPEFFWGFWVNGIYAINDMNILVYGTYGFGSAVLFSNNRGATFKLVYYYDQQYYYENPGVNKVHFPQGTSFAGYALEYNSILKTNNGGINWSRIYYNPNANFKDLIFFNSSQGYAVNNGVLQKTTNGGTSWTTVATPGDYVNSISFLDFERGYITRERNLYFTENGGQTWQLVNDNNLYPVLGQVKFIDAAKGYVLGQ